ncbi:hypothetical protein [Streptomyces sp. SHP 1-2]|uniref:hypothetical protein n=1 Tax=Streptomyces sp. SHP 1-2 TaxID=2769489 RepID=UPI0022377B06|nr:hypothetical protein [Streptomyces sp. SHP 1-2]
MNELSRRRVLGAAGALAGAAAPGVPAVTPSTAAATPLRTDQAATTWRGSRSANGWKILDQAESHSIEGSGRSVRLAGGEAATLLLHVARRFHYEIDQLRAGDVTGHLTSRTVRHPHESNYLSGTSIETMDIKGVKVDKQATRETKEIIAVDASAVVATANVCGAGYTISVSAARYGTYGTTYTWTNGRTTDDRRQLLRQADLRRLLQRHRKRALHAPQTGR